MLSDDAPETGGGRGSWEKKRKGGEKKKKKRRMVSKTRKQSRRKGKVAMGGGCVCVEGDDEWIFRSETPPSGAWKATPFPFETRIESNGIPLWFIAAVSRVTFVKKRDIFLSKRVDTKRVDSPLLRNGVSKRFFLVDTFVYKGAVHPSFRPDLVWIALRMIEIRTFDVRWNVDFSFNLCFEKVDT